MGEISYDLAIAEITRALEAAFPGRAGEILAPFLRQTTDFAVDAMNAWYRREVSSAATRILASSGVEFTGVENRLTRAAALKLDEDLENSLRFHTAGNTDMVEVDINDEIERQMGRL